MLCFQVHLSKSEEVLQYVDKNLQKLLVKVINLNKVELNKLDGVALIKPYF